MSLVRNKEIRLGEDIQSSLLPSSALRYCTTLGPRWCLLGTKGPMTGSLLALSSCSLQPSVAYGLGASFGQLTCRHIVSAVL